MDQFSASGKEGGALRFPAVSSRCVGSSVLASLSEAGGDALLQLASKPLPPRSPSSAKRHFWNAPSPFTLQVGRQFQGRLDLRASPPKSVDSQSCRDSAGGT